MRLKLIHAGRNEHETAKINLPNVDVPKLSGKKRRKKNHLLLPVACRFYAGFTRVRHTSSGVQWANAFPRNSSRGTIISRRSLFLLAIGCRRRKSRAVRICHRPIAARCVLSYSKKNPRVDLAQRLSACRAIRAARSVVEDGFQLIGARAREKRVYEAIQCDSSVPVRRSARVTEAEIAGCGLDRVRRPIAARAVASVGRRVRLRMRFPLAPYSTSRTSARRRLAHPSSVRDNVTLDVAGLRHATGTSRVPLRQAYLPSCTANLLYAHARPREEAPADRRARTRRASARDPVVTSLAGCAWRSARPDRLRISRFPRDARRECSPFECAI